MKLRQRLSVTALAFVLLSSSADVVRCLEMACENIPIPAGNDVVIPFLSKNGQCEQEAYVQMNASGYALDVKAEADGACDIHTPDGSGGCSYVRTEHRGIIGVNIQDQALGISGGQIVFNNNPSKCSGPPRL